MRLIHDEKGPNERITFYSSLGSAAVIFGVPCDNNLELIL
jgi:hypothetical protein